VPALVTTHTNSHQHNPPEAILLPANLTSKPDQATFTTDASPKSPVSDPDAFALVEAQFQAFNNHDNLPTSMDM
jgi:hypothetical protein